MDGQMSLMDFYKDEMYQVQSNPDSAIKHADTIGKKEEKGKKELKDFGEKIGGARKDIWKERGLLASDLAVMNDGERDKFVKKDNIWKKPDYEEMVRNGLPVRVAYFMKQVRDSLPPKPVIYGYGASVEEIREKQEGYITVINAFRDAVMAVKTEQDIQGFYNDFVVGQGYVVPKGGYSRYVEFSDKCFDTLNSKVLRAVQVTASDLRKYDREIEKKEFCFTKEQSALKGYEIRKYSEVNHTWSMDYNDRMVLQYRTGGSIYYMYPKDSFADVTNWKDNTFYVLRNNTILQNNFECYEEAHEFALAHGLLAKGLNEQASSERKKEGKKAYKVIGLRLVRPSNGSDVRKGKDMAGEDYLKDFRFKGGEFGNWLNETERQDNMNFAYDAFQNLADVLQVEPSDISLGNRLSIAFGARGHGDALAHFEPLREVINLTKMKGAGSLAHEWGHAMDFILGKESGLRECMTKNGDARNGFPEIANLISSMLYKEGSKEEAMKRNQELVSKRQEQFIGWVKYYIPDSRLNEEQKQRRDAIVEQMIKDAPATKMPLDLVKTNNYDKDTNLQELNSLYKEATNHILPKSERKDIMISLYHLGSAMNAKVDTVRVETDFYKNSKTFDLHYSRCDKGYWQSGVEMFARAFSCYVYDKLEEKGVHDDYLCGHCNTYTAHVMDKNGNDSVIHAYPVGEERKVINQCFDKVIDSLKEKGLLHHRETGELQKDSQKNLSSSAKEKSSLEDKKKPAKSKGMEH